MPYRNLPPQAFWKLCRESSDFRMAELYAPKFALEPGMKVATAGSCFAQNFGRYVRGSELDLIDVEPAPHGMAEAVAKRFGYGLYSARYGNIYTARQLRQLLEDTAQPRVHPEAIWAKGGRVFDALRPSSEPDGFASEAELIAHRLDHLQRVRSIFEDVDVFVFTLGLTEAWVDQTSGVVFPSAPGVIAGTYDPDRTKFANFSVAETARDLASAVALMREWAPDVQIILTVSPVPLTATASGDHVLQATSYSKAVLRAVAGEASAADPLIDYFPSYEIITGAPFAGQFFESNLRNVTEDGVRAAMATFFGAHSGLAPLDGGAVSAIEPAHLDDESDDLICEDALLEAFAQR